MFSRSTKTRLARKDKTDLSMPIYLTTRLWLMWKVLKQAFSAFCGAQSFLENVDLPPSRLQMLEILRDPP